MGGRGRLAMEAVTGTGGGGFFGKDFAPWMA